VVQSNTLSKTSPALCFSLLVAIGTDPKRWVCEWGGSYRLNEQNAQDPEQLIDGARLGGTSLHTIRVTNPVLLPDTVCN
jgi:hypothetical protein